MQQTETGSSSPAPPARRGLSPPAALAVVALIALVGVGAMIVMARGGSTPLADPPKGSVVEPRDPEAEVTASLEALLELKDRAFDTHNIAMLDEVYTDGSTTLARARRALKRLMRHSVYDHARYEQTALTIQNMTEDRAVLEYVYVHYPCFRSASGDDVTQATGVVEKHTLYTLHRERERWQVDSIELVGEKILRKEVSSCARG